METKKHPNFQDLYSIEDINKAKACSKQTGYYPISLMPGDQTAVLGNTPRLGAFKLSNTSQRSYTLRYWYAMQVWNTAIAIACDSVVGNKFLGILPQWKDRDESFRMLVNNKKFTSNMVEELWKLLEDIANSGNIRVHEGFFMENTTKGYWGAPSKCNIEMRCKFYINIILDVPSARTNKFPIENIWEHKFCKEDKSYRWDEIKHLFCEVSLPVRELMNHEWMNRKGDYDAELIEACRNLDLEGVKAAAGKGANVNALDSGDETPLTNAIDDYYLTGMKTDVYYTEEDKSEIENNNYQKLIPIIDYLLEQGADIDLFGYDGLSPVTAAYYTHSPRLVEYLLKKGANPNVNCFLIDTANEGMYCSTILSCIAEDMAEEYDDAEREIERLVKQYGGRLYYFGYNPVKREYTGRTFVEFWPTKDSLFENSAYDKCGDYKTLRIETSENTFTDVDISSVEGLEQWHKEFVDHYYDDESTRTNDEWNIWFSKGLEFAKKVKSLLPGNIDLYYLYDCKPIFCTRKDGSKYWNQWNGERILIE